MEVDMQTLLVSAQRVCKQWFQIIGSSTPLQRKLYFLPDTNVTKEMENPLLARKFPIWFAHRNYSRRCSSHKLQAFTTMIAADAPSYRPNASWRKMLVQQPPILRWIISTSYPRGQDDDISENCSFQLNNGLRMELFHDRILRMLPEATVPFKLYFIWTHIPKGVAALNSPERGAEPFNSIVSWCH